MNGAARLALVVVALAAVSTGALAPAAAQDSGAVVERVVTRGMHEQVRFDKDVARVAVGDPKILESQTLTSRSILLLGKETGRTSLLVWFADDSVQTFVVNVEPDFDILRRALKEIHPNISADLAPDRPAIVLRGVVPDASYARAAEAAAGSYLRSGKGQRAPLVQVNGTGAGTGAPRSAEAPESRDTGIAPQDTAVINLIRVEKLPSTIEDRLQAAIKDLDAPYVTVHRLVRGDSPNDLNDVILLKGKVRSQIALTRILNLAATMFVGPQETGSAITIGADEGGGLPDGGGGSSERASGRSSGGISSDAAFSGLGSGASLDNEIHSNPARAKLVTVAKGRILSMIEVTDVPQVRVGVRIYEVNRTELLQYAPEITALWGDFNQSSLSPAPGAVGIQGTQASRVGPTSTQDVQGVMSFLENGLTQQFQFTSSHFAVDALFSILESRSLARALASPSITVLSGENANFQVGGEIPVPESFAPAFGSTQPVGSETTPGVFNSVRFRTFGVGLAVRPLVGDDGRVTIDLLSNVDQPDEDLTTLVRNSTGTDPQTTAFSSRRIETTTRLEDGQCLLLGGLISRRATDSASHTPLMERIPGLGWLFKRFDIKDEDTEVVIVINPAIIRDRLPGVGVWAYPDLGTPLRKWVDDMIGYARPEAPEAKK